MFHLLKDLLSAIRNIADEVHIFQQDNDILVHCARHKVERRYAYLDTGRSAVEAFVGQIGIDYRRFLLFHFSHLCICITQRTTCCSLW